MSLALPVLAALGVGILLGGRASGLAELRLRAWPLFIAAIAIQVVAFPFGVLPWRVDSTVATVLWLASYGLLVVAAILNRRVAGVPLVAVGMGANVVAIVANGGSTPVLPAAMRDAGADYVTRANSTANAEPRLAWLVDRWAAPDWIPLANVFSVGDVVIAVGAMVVVLAAMGVGQRPPASAAGASS
jgi:hypothetical protein